MGDSITPNVNSEEDDFTKTHFTLAPSESYGCFEMSLSNSMAKQPNPPDLTGVFIDEQLPTDNLSVLTSLGNDENDFLVLYLSNWSNVSCWWQDLKIQNFGCRSHDG